MTSPKTRNIVVTKPKYDSTVISGSTASGICEASRNATVYGRMR